MIEVIFLFNSETYRVLVNGKNILFGKSINEGYLAPIDKLQLSKSGVIKEFPDLENNKEWRKLAIERFKAKVESMNSETDITKYVINDLAKFGYKPIKLNRKGFRPKTIKNGKY